MTAVLTVEQAEDLARRTLDRIAHREREPWPNARQYAADRERVESDLAGLREHNDTRNLCYCGTQTLCPDAARYAAGLLRTARLYGVEPA